MNSSPKAKFEKRPEAGEEKAMHLSGGNVQAERTIRASLMSLRNKEVWLEHSE